ncbi:MAG: hypothetical protein B7X30_05470 [Thiomonas sp. 13-64-67]|jgi:response regulator of citrate/malate metabolism|nr:MAG: hypothetical protein B7X30_05470 [Thiomonas sp. 13-64-67]
MGAGVITMDMIGKIQRMHFRQNKSARVIARSTGLSRNTVRTWLRQPGDVVSRYAVVLGAACGGDTVGGTIGDI